MYLLIVIKLGLYFLGWPLESTLAGEWAVIVWALWLKFGSLLINRPVFGKSRPMCSRFLYEKPCWDFRMLSSYSFLMYGDWWSLLMSSAFFILVSIWTEESATSRSDWRARCRACFSRASRYAFCFWASFCRSASVFCASSSRLCSTSSSPVRTTAASSSGFS